MIVKIRIPRLSLPSFSAGSAVLSMTPATAGASFHATLTDCAEDWVVHHSPSTEILSTNAITRQLQRPAPGLIQRAWHWVNRKYIQTGTKRLRVAETVSLGEKRFVALVHVEDCEFLIGGGASGISLLTQLRKAPVAADLQQSNLGVEGDSQ